MSGQLPIDSKTVKFVSEEIKEQTLQVINNIEAILKVEISCIAVKE